VIDEPLETELIVDVLLGELNGNGVVRAVAVSAIVVDVVD
jgi:hypothetical protein